MPEEGMEDNKGREERPKWNNKAEYLLTCIGFAVGVGNVWRFPYLCQIYGGGAFLIPYLIALVFQGLPLLYLELAIGQRLRMGSIGVWNSISPYLGGVGVASMVVSFCVSLFYNTIVAWVLWYLFNSFQDPLPWSQCPLNHNNTGYVKECVESTPVNYFWYRQTLNITPNMETSGSLQWWLVVSLATAWSIIYICFIRGIETIGKAVYVTATFPYLVLTIFLVRALTLPGSSEGLIYLFTPDWEILKNPQVWLDAATQIFFSLSVAFGGLISFSSYNSQKNNCERDAVLVGVINSATSIYASIPIFAILGFKAHTNYVTCLNGNILALTNEFDISDMNITVENYEQWFDSLNGTHPSRVSDLNLKTCDLQTFLDQSASGTGLAFIVFTEAVISMPGSQVWAVLFFIMLFSLGLSSMFGNLEGILTPLHDLKLVPKWMPNELFTAIICLVLFLMALIFCLGSGNYWLEIFNSYVGSVPFLIIAFFEIIAVAYIYGIGRFSDDLEFMTGHRPNIFWKVCWLVISPLMLFVVLVAYVAVQAQTHPTYAAWNPDYVNFPDTEVLPYPDWVFAICVLLSSVPVISIPLVAIYRLICCMSGRHSKGSLHNDPNPYVNEGYVVES
ncbi:sodium-dependent neutral amino acid transporter B(0)AT1-like isoform X2 [Salvelinus namaycush]|uniref:Transporter n=1 Tax=Salvelinus namaycush TaxID=8040 RepID=A0A8U0U3R1_SALNM|nr:sodium-dependent neutral amino acid transporter B(0)AT1-like isoform X2 [Salvelinus namaycush]XP_038838614.1 sodium-dependent neutral amino acid transporter B(0)AT1-like isoform X2 [Salvelinus namaycush]